MDHSPPSRHFDESARRNLTRFSEVDGVRFLASLGMTHMFYNLKKEAKETKYWLHMVSIAMPAYADEARRLWSEAKELNLIFNAITNASREGDR